MTNTTTTTPVQEQQANELSTPWTLQFDRDGTEDFGIICDAEGNDLVASHLPQRMPPRWANREFGEGCFWLPEEGDEIPLLVRQMRLMATAPKLLKALQAYVTHFESTASYEELLIRNQAVSAIFEATCGLPGRSA